MGTEMVVSRMPTFLTHLSVIRDLSHLLHVARHGTGALVIDYLGEAETSMCLATHHVLSLPPYVIICTSFISSMDCSICYRITISLELPLVPKSDVQHFSINIEVNVGQNEINDI